MAYRGVRAAMASTAGLRSELEVIQTNEPENEAAKNGLGDVSNLPYSLKVLLENILRFDAGDEDARGDVKAFAEWVAARRSDRPGLIRPAGPPRAPAQLPLSGSAICSSSSPSESTITTGG